DIVGHGLLRIRLLRAADEGLQCRIFRHCGVDGFERVPRLSGCDTPQNLHGGVTRDSSGSRPSLHRVSTPTLSQEAARHVQRHLGMCRIPLRDRPQTAATTKGGGREPYESGFVEAAEGTVDGDGAAVTHETV